MISDPDDQQLNRQEALRLIDEAKQYENRGEESKAICAYLQAGDVAVRARLFDNPQFDVSHQIYSGLNDRMKAIWEGYELMMQSESDKRRGLERVKGIDFPIYKVE